MKRTFRELIPRSESLRKRLRQALSSGVIAGIGLAIPTEAPAKENTLAPTDGQPITLVNRSAKSKKLILQLPSGMSYRLLQHRSHSSHSSHSSHASHYSGTSSAPSRPAPAPQPTAPKPVLAEAAPPVADPAQLFFNATIETVNKEARTITLKRLETGTQHILTYRDDTTIRSLTGDESRLDEEMEKRNGGLPFSKGQKVQVQWRDGTNGKTIAVKITHMK